MQPPALGAAGPRCLPVEERVERAAQLEGAGALLVLSLDPDGAGGVGEVELQQRRATHAADQQSMRAVIAAASTDSGGCSRCSIIVDCSSLGRGRDLPVGGSASAAALTA